MTKSTISREEIGKKGGEARAREYTPAELSEQAKQGARTVEEKNPGFHSKIGEKGGKARAEKYTHEELSEQAQKAAETIEKKEPGFHSKIGSKGGSQSQRSQKNKKNLSPEEEEVSNESAEDLNILDENNSENYDQ